MTDAEIDALDGPELGVACATHIMGWPHEGDLSQLTFGEIMQDRTPPYTYISLGGWLRVVTSLETDGDNCWHPWEDMNAAWEIVEKVMAFGADWEAGGAHETFMHWWDGADLYQYSTKEAARLICQAALKAKFAKGGDTAMVPRS